MPDRDEPLPSAEQELLAQLRPAWERAQRLESPPPQALARARALYRQQAALVPPRARTRPFLLPFQRASVYGLTVFAVGFLLVLFIGAWSAVIDRANGALPGESLYPIKIQVEQVRLTTTLSRVSRAELSIQLAQTRIREVQVLAERGEHDQIPDTLAAFDDLVETGSIYLESAARTKPGQVAASAGKLERILQDSEDALGKIAPLVTEAQPAVARAMAVSRKGELAVNRALVTATQSTPSTGGTSPRTVTGTLAPGRAAGATPITAAPMPGITNAPAAAPVPPMIAQPTNTHKPDNTPQPTNTHKPDKTPQPTNTLKPDNAPQPTNTQRPTKTSRP